MKCIISYRVQALKKIKEQEISIGSVYMCVCFFVWGNRVREIFDMVVRESVLIKIGYAML